MLESKDEGVQDEEQTILGELERELKNEKERNAELLTRLKYAQADLENYRKRADRELKEASESAARPLISRLLVIQDELDLAVKHAEKGAERADLMEGIGMVQRNLLSTLRAVGVEKIEAVGRPFDPAVHEAVAKSQGNARGADMVVEEVRPGFLFRGQVLRPSMVKVELASKAASGEAKVSE
ncbi:MAG: nucleotide exchange factor GrpE [Nitrososphaerota archaeon]|nr:nucleotide exchange factor GrpE [Nitrososphaerota archaeon]